MKSDFNERYEKEARLSDESIRTLMGDDEDGKELFKDLVDLFFKDAPNRISGIVEAIGEKDPKRLEYEAHTLKGSCGNLGALKLAEICKDLVDLSRAGEMDNATSYKDILKTEYDEVIGNLKYKVSEIIAE